MSGLTNLIKSLFSGIFNFIGGLFGSKKSDAAIEPAKPKPKKSSNGFYLELEDTKDTGNSSVPSQPAESVTTPVATEKKAEKKTEKKPSKRSEQLAAAKAEAGTNKPTQAPKAPEPAAVAQSLNLPQPTVTTFAPDYLLPTTTNGRRRPGANMASYLDMARKVKTSTQG